MSKTTDEGRRNLTVTVRHHRRGPALDEIRAIGGVHIGQVDTSFGSHTIVPITAPAKAVGNGLLVEVMQAQWRHIRRAMAAFGDRLAAEAAAILAAAGGW